MRQQAALRHATAHTLRQSGGNTPDAERSCIRSCSTHACRRAVSETASPPFGNVQMPFASPAHLTTLPRTTETPFSCTAAPRVHARGPSGTADSARANAWASSTPASQSTHRLHGDTRCDPDDMAGAAPAAAIAELLIYDVLRKVAKGVW